MMKRKLFACLLCLSMLTGLLSTSAFAGALPSAWAMENVTQAIKNGLVPQSLQTNYDQGITRAQFCALAVALYENVTGSEIANRATFPDTSDINVQKMAGLKIVNGTGDGTFNPNGQLTREQAATILTRLSDTLGQPLPATAATFADNGQISSWALDAVGRMQASGIMGGTGANQFAPAGIYTVEQSIVTALRVFNTMPAKEKGEPTDITLYENSDIKVELYKIEKDDVFDGSARLYLDITNKTSETLTFQAHAFSFNGWCVERITMSDDVSADSIGTVEARIADYPFDKVPLDEIETIGGQLRYFSDGHKIAETKLFYRHDLYTGDTVTDIPEVSGKPLLYSDEKLSMYYNGAEYDSYLGNNDRIKIHLLVKNKTNETLVIQNDTVKIAGRSYGNTTMSDTVLPYSVGYVSTSVKDIERAPDPATIATIGGQYHIISDAKNFKSYSAVLSDNATEVDGKTPSTGTGSSSGITADSLLKENVEYGGRALTNYTVSGEPQFNWYISSLKFTEVSKYGVLHYQVKGTGAWDNFGGSAWPLSFYMVCYDENGVELEWVFMPVLPQYVLPGGGEFSENSGITLIDRDTLAKVASISLVGYLHPDAPKD